jgi:hypothetical protein
MLSGQLRKWIDSFQPEAVFSMLGYAPIIRLAVMVSEWRNVPLIPYFTDDWIGTSYRDPHLLTRIMRRGLLYWFERCLERSKIRLTCSPFMAAEYSRRYGGQFEVMFYPVDARGPRKASPVNNPTRLVYIGGLAPDRARSLCDIGKAVEVLRREGIKAELFLYAFPFDIERHGKYLTEEGRIHVVGTASPEEVDALQSSADVLLHVESFSSEARRYTEYSLSTKIPQFLMRGGCIFAYGPEEGSSQRYLRSNACGVVVGEQNPAALIASLRMLLNSPGRMDALRQKAYEIGMKNHEASQQRRRFADLIYTLCSASRT